MYTNAYGNGARCDGESTSLNGNTGGRGGLFNVHERNQPPVGRVNQYVDTVSHLNKLI